MSLRVILDFDNTAGIPRFEIDDALALLYLLSRREVEILGVTTTFGNGTIDEVTTQTNWLLRKLGRTDIPCARGAEHAGDWDTPAAQFIAETCAKLPGDVSVVAIGPLGNLAGASRLDPRFFENVAGVWAMGGITGPLRFPSRTVSELNLSCDPAASYTVLTAPAPVHLMSAQLCLGLRFDRSHVASLRRFPLWFRTLVGDWYRHFSSAVGTEGFYLWDLVPVVDLLERDRVSERLVRLDSTLEDLRDGILRTRTGDALAPRDSGVIDLPILLSDAESTVADVMQGWARAFLEEQS